MNDRQREIVDAATDSLMAQLQEGNGELKREDVSELLYQLTLEVLKRPSSPLPEDPRARRMPAAGEVLPRHQRASWARNRTTYDAY